MNCQTAFSISLPPIWYYPCISVPTLQEPWESYCVEPPCGQLNLANPAMYDVLGQIYKELVHLFSPLELFHFGGDEVKE